MIASGVIRTPRGPLSGRLNKIFEGLEEVIGAHQPDAVAVEEVFHARNPKSALVLGHARGVALLAAGRAGVSVHEYSARKVKQTVTGHGNADKRQVRSILEAQLGELPDQLDASDALAVALCHLRWSDAPVARDGSS
jgi:crossover junction endodeoxyribonuclease RuvC